MTELGDADNPVGLAWGRGIPEAVAETIIPARYNDIDVLRRLFERDGEEIAAIIVEPVLGNAQGILPAARLPPGDAGPDPGVRDPPDLRRGQDRLPVREGRRRRVLRHHAGPRDLRQGDGQRLPGGGVRRPPRGHGASCPTRSATAARTPATGSPPPRPSRRSRSCATRTRSRRSTPPADASRPGSARSSTRPASPTSSPATRRCSGSCSPRPGADRVPRLGEHRPRAVRRGRARHARPRRDARAGLPRAVVHLRGPRRGRHRRPGRHRSSRTRSTRRSRPAPTAGSRRTQRRRYPAQHGRTGRTERRWSSTGTPSARSTGPRPCCSPSAIATARPG